MGGYTPGPWWADASRYGTVYIEANAVIDKRLLQEICAVGPTESGRGQQLANARLIAAAPTLLEAAFRLCSGGARKITGAWVKRFDACVESILGFQPPATYMLDTSAGASA